MPLRSFKRLEDGVSLFSFVRTLSMITILAKRSSRTISYCGLLKFPRLFSDASAPAADRSDRKVVDVSAPAVDLFPWISKPSPLFRNPLYNLFNKLKIASSIIAFDILQRCRVENIEPCSKEAMMCAAMGIFRHKLMNDHYMGISSKYNKSSEVILQEIQDETSNVDLSMIFDKKLEDFYLYAIQKHCLNTSQLCTYSLQSVTDARMVDILAYMSARRDGTTPEHDIQVSSWGATFFIDSEKFPERGFTMMSRILNELESQQKNYTDSTVRIKVDVDCIEVFAVTNAVTGEVLQGSLRPQKVTHQLLLENYVDGKTRELAGSWTIVDIDNWLQGNEFWAKAKIHRQTEDEEE